MTLHTICIDGLPTLVMSTDTDDSMAEEDRIMEARSEIDGALDTWLGEDLMCMRYEGKPLWTGNRDILEVREATVDEASTWKVSRQSEIDSGNEETDLDDWLVYLVAVTDD